MKSIRTEEWPWWQWCLSAVGPPPTYHLVSFAYRRDQRCLQPGHPRAWYPVLSTEREQPLNHLFSYQKLKERGFIVVKKPSEHPKKSSNREDHSLKLNQLQHWGSTGAELVQKWQQAGVSTFTCSEVLDDGLASRRATKKPLPSWKNIRDRLMFCKRYRLLRTRVKSFSLDSLSDCLAHLAKS